MYRTLACLFLACALACGADAQPQAVFPSWDGQESVEQYARRANLPPTKTLDLGNDVNLELVLIPAGKFIMGTPEPESPWIGGAVLGIASLIVLVLVELVLRRAARQNRRPQFSRPWLIVVVLILGVATYGGLRCWRAVQASRNFVSWESPAHAVTLTKAFYMGGCEVTQEQYVQVMGKNPSHFIGASLPVESVQWNGAQEFCKKASQKTGQTVRLPTEAEWEFACRAGTTTNYYTGDAEAGLSRAGWYYGNSGAKTHPVGQKTPNAWGLYDMHGNVFEWCLGLEQYPPEAAVDPQGPPVSRGCVARGGAWDMHPKFCRSAMRGWGSLSIRCKDAGFRVLVAAPRIPSGNDDF